MTEHHTMKAYWGMEVVTLTNPMEQNLSWEPNSRLAVEERAHHWTILCQMNPVESAGLYIFVGLYVFANDKFLFCINGRNHLCITLSSINYFSLANDKGSTISRTVGDFGMCSLSIHLRHTAVENRRKCLLHRDYLQLQTRVWQLFVFLMSFSLELRRHYCCENIHLHV
jgi:hypothetical protein